jgi:hypothetical protein
MSELATILNSTFFIIVERDPVYVAQSLYQARIRIHGDASIGWGLGTGQSSADHPTDPSRSVSDQVIQMVERTRSEIAMVPSDRLIRVQYEEFCAEPKKQIRRVTDAIQDFTQVPLERSASHSFVPDSFPCRNSKDLTDDVFVDLKRSLVNL